ncbi:hypothetical protein BJ875DRAFT_468735 [Amylocarpus encephaloides]|uniref:SH3 domain-containing protein n=1 Tax=Amylocarpus encephaloides TaxID=45428 RepID=A0A9P7YEF7_9HELO|nr:hypothetical protein BJ875DRAFT_468735 [Amylocarpus encephaloides]
MSTGVVAPVKSILKSLDSGIKLAKRTARSADLAPRDQAVEIFESARALQRSLERSSKSISDAYEQSSEICGLPFARALLQDPVVQGQLKDLRIDLMDQLDKCQDFDEEPDSFEAEAFTSFDEQAQKCRDILMGMFHGLRDRHFQNCLQSFRTNPRGAGERQSTAMVPHTELNAGSQFPDSPDDVSPTSHFGTMRSDFAVPPMAPSPAPPPMPRSPWAIDIPSQFDLGATTNGPYSTTYSPTEAPPQRKSLQELPAPLHPYSNQMQGQIPQFIPMEIVHSRIDANDEFLERRRRSRVLFQNEITNMISAFSSFSSCQNEDPSSSPTEEYRGTESYGDHSIPEHSVISSPATNSRISRSSSSGYDSLMTRQRSQGQFSHGTRSSTTSSVQHDQQHHRPKSLTNSLASSKISPKTVPAKLASPTRRGSENIDTWGTLSSTLHVPGYAAGIDSGLEVAVAVDRENEKMVVEEEAPAVVYPPSTPTPTASMKSIDCPIAHDTSFYRFGGFCDGSKAMMRGESGFKVVKRPSGHYSATVSARCVKCSYEVGWNDVEKDRLLSREGIYGNSGIRWRQKFISKCHVKTSSIEEPLYACIFCIEEHKTVEEHDATVFFSVSQLFRHLAKHPRPLPNIYGINTIYGQQPHDMVDFDLHFTMPDPHLPQHNMTEIASKVACRAKAHASNTHNPKPTGKNARDPDGHQSMHFAAGARIVGITFPDRFAGLWCTGYHDGERGTFPAEKIVLEMPVKEDVLMNSRSSLTAVAKWDFKPKEAKEGNWLKFSKGDRINCIGYTFVDQWCWSGQTGKGKWGLFPSCFVKELKDSNLIPGARPQTAKSVSSKSGWGLSIGRNKSKHERSNSAKSNETFGIGRS